MLFIKHFYKFSNGPFKHAMISHGYNPLSDRDSIYFQTIATNKKINMISFADSKQGKSNFISKKKYNCFQIGEIKNETISNFIKEFLKENEGKIEFDYTTGWFTKEAFRNLKKLIHIELH
jgi:hypothetical protein